MLSSKQPLAAPMARAHAVKNCLAVIAAVNGLLELTLDEDARKRLARSKQALRRVTELIDETLQVPDETLQPGTARPEEHAMRVLSIQAVFDLTRLRVEDLAVSRGIELDFRLGSGSIHGDAEGLAEAMTNLIKNAIEASRQGGTIEITSTPSADGGQLWTVRDFGCGVDAQTLPRLGTPHFSNRTGGSGLGVAVVRDVVARHGGLMQIESAPGWGTRVSIWLPVSPA